MPDKVSVPLLFAPDEMLAPPARLTVSAPWSTDSCVEARLPSTSWTEIALPPVKPSGTSSFTVSVPAGTVFTGASLVLPTMMLNVSEADALLVSVAVTFTATVPTSPLAGVPENVRVAASKPSQDGSVLPSDSVAV